MISVMKNDWLRTKNSFASIGVMFALIIGVIIVSYTLDNRTSVFATVAVMKESSEKIDSQELKVVYVNKKPLNSELIKGTYDAFISYKDAKVFSIDTFKGKEFKSELLDILENHKNKDVNSKAKDRVGTRLLSYLLMFLLMASLTNMKLFSEEKEKKLFERIVTTPVSFSKVLLGHSVFAFLLIFLPTIISIYAINLIFQKELGLSFMALSSLLSFICVFSTTLSLMITSLFKEGDKANMFGSLVIIITTMLSGSFFSFEGGNRWLTSIIQFLPQKRFLLLFKDVQTGQNLQVILPNIVYISAFTVLFFILSIIVTKRSYQLK